MAYKVLGTPVIDDSRNILNIQNLNVAGISTLGTLKVASGIVTATAGVITYYGDGRNLNLDGIQINASVASATTATNVIGGRADVTQLNVSGLSTVGTLGAGDITATNFYSAAGVVTATEFHTGASGSAIRLNSNTISGPSVLYLDPSAVGDNTGAVRIKGDLIVDGTQTIVNSTQVDIADKVIGIGSTSSPSDVTADGGGILLYGTTNKTFTWSDTTDAWTSSEDLNLASGKVYEIDGTTVLSSTTLGSGVVNSSLTSVGTLGKLDVGNVNSTGIVTAVTLNATNLNVTGVTTLAVVNTGDIYSTGVITATTFSGTFSGTVTGTATTATRATLIDTTATSTDASYYLSFVSSASTSQAQTLRVDEGIRFNPSNNRLGINTTVLDTELSLNGVIGFTNSNVRIGSNQTSPNVTGSSNISIGDYAGNALTAGTRNVLIGDYANAFGSNGSYNVMLGYKGSTQGSHNIHIGELHAGGSGNYNVVIGNGDAANNYNFGVPDSSKDIQFAVGVNTTSSNPSDSKYWIVGDENFNIGIGTNAPTSKLDVLGNAKISGSVTANSLTINGSQIVSSAKELQNIATIDATTKATLEAALQISPNNFDDITVSGISTFNAQVTVNSDVSVTGIVTAGDFNSTSDRRLKDNILTISEPLTKVAQINGVTFTWKESGESSGGVIAQDVETVLPELVSNGEVKTVNYNGLIGLLIESVKELSAEVAELKAKLG